MSQQTKELTQSGFNQLHDPSYFIEVSKNVQKFVTDNRLYTTIQNKKYTMVEGWQMAGGLLGLVPILESLDDLSDKEQLVFKYRAKVNLKNVHTGEIVGVGIAICSSKEKKKRYFDEYAIASMAHTRAIGKAFRATCGWLMKAAGFEATPAEEMDNPLNESSEPSNRQVRDEYLRFAEYCIMNAKNASTVKRMAEIAQSFHHEPSFIDTTRRKYQQLTILESQKDD